MILPIYAGLERIPSSLLEASADLGGRSFTTFRRVVLPLVFPAVVAGSIFTFLTLGDYIAPGPIDERQFIGTVIYIRGQALPTAAAFSMVPIVVVIAYLRRPEAEGVRVPLMVESRLSRLLLHLGTGRRLFIYGR